MPAYLNSAYVTSVVSTTEEPEDMYDAVIPAVLEDVDARTGQFFSSGYDGSYELSSFDVSRDMSVLYPPRMFSVDRVECRYRGGAWEELDASSWEAGLVRSQSWSGFDTIYLGRYFGYGSEFRVSGKIGWGHGTEDENDPFMGDAVPAKLKLEVAKQCRYETSRLSAGAPSGMDLMSGDMSTRMDSWDLLMSVRQTLRRYTDGRRGIGI